MVDFSTGAPKLQLYEYITERQNLKHSLPSSLLRVVFLGQSQLPIPAQVQIEFDNHILDPDSIMSSSCCSLNRLLLSLNTLRY